MNTRLESDAANSIDLNDTLNWPSLTSKSKSSSTSERKPVDENIDLVETISEQAPNNDVSCDKLGLRRLRTDGNIKLQNVNVWANNNHEQLFTQRSKVYFCQTETKNNAVSSGSEKVEASADLRSREEIVEARKVRRKEKRELLKRENLERKRLEKITGPKGQQVSLITQEAMLKIVRSFEQKRESSNYFCTEKIQDFEPNDLFKQNDYSKKQIKRKDPVKIDLFQRTGIAHAPTRTKIRTKNEPIYSGNSLDSSQPIRHRGKKREFHKKRISSLKKLILQQREIRKNNRTNCALLQYISESASSSTLKSENSEHENLLDSEVNTSVDIMKNVIDLLSNDDCTNKKCDSLDDLSVVDDFKMLNVEDDSQTKINDDSKQETMKKVFSRNFREYCENFTTTELKTATKALLRTLVRLQDRRYQNDPIKGQAKRRLVSGFKQTKRALENHKACMVIIAPDIERIQNEDGSQCIVAQLKHLAAQDGIPCMYSLKRNELGYETLKKVKVSCVAILDKDGTEDLFKTCLDLLNEAKEQFADAGK